MTRREDDAIDTTLATLGGEGASVGFTAQVLATLSARRERRRRRRRQAAGVTVVVLAAIVFGLPHLLDDDAMTASEISSEAELLEQEYTRLQSDLEELRSSARKSAPVIYLGGNDELDLVLDLAPIVTRSAAAGVSLTSTNEDPFEL